MGFLMNETSINDEIMRNAIRLVTFRGHKALDFTAMMVGRMQDEGDEYEQTPWNIVSRQDALLLNEKR